MLNKLTFRNAKRSAGNYLIYLVTMTIISTLMFAFHSMMFSADMKALYDEIAIFIALIGVASFFIGIIIIWLTHYMVNFMLEKRSREFGTYLLLGIRKKQIARLFTREHILLGIASMILGILPSFVVQKIFTSIFYAILETEYTITLDINPWGVLLTFGVLLLAYLLALTGVRRKLKKLHIRDLMVLDRQNEQVSGEKKTWKMVFVFLSLAYIVCFNILALNSGMDENTVWFFIAGLIAAIYLLYVGLSPFFVGHIQAKRKGLYKGANLFILRQLASKIRTMRFTMGTLTILFTAALLGFTVVMMVADYQKTELDKQIPFDVAAFSDVPDHSFAEQMRVVEENAALSDSYIYNIYHNETHAINDYLYAHVEGTWKNDVFIDGKMGPSTYYAYDTLMSLRDYNRLRGMLGLSEVALENGKYILHGKEKIDDQLLEISEGVPVVVGGTELTCQAVYREPLQQNRMNGADYIVVVADEWIPTLTPYYSVMVGALEGEVPRDLQEKLRDTLRFLDEESGEELYAIEVGEGSSQVLVVSGNVMVADNLKTEGNFVTVSLCFMMAYVGIVFLCAALTIMTVQQLSDASKYRFRYRILRQLGMSKTGVEKIVFRQLLAYYLCPYAVSVALSAWIGLFASERFVYFTGIQAPDFPYYLMALLVFTFVYAAYFIISYVGFNRHLRNR